MLCNPSSDAGPRRRPSGALAGKAGPCAGRDAAGATAPAPRVALRAGQTPRPGMTRARATLLLLLAALFWGAGNVAGKTVGDHLAAPWVVLLRCATALPVLVLLARRERGPVPWAFVTGLAPVALLFAAALSTQQLAMTQARVSNMGFLISMAVVLTPLLDWAVFRRRPGPQVVVAAAVTAMGAFLLAGATLDPQAWQSGDRLCLLSALMWAGWTVAVREHATRFGRPLSMALGQTALAIPLLLPLALSRGLPAPADVAAALPDLMVLGVLATALTSALTASALRHMAAGPASVIVSADSLVGLSGAVVLLGERPAPAVLLGGALILLAIAIAATERPRPPPARQ